MILTGCNLLSLCGYVDKIRSIASSRSSSTSSLIIPEERMNDQEESIHLSACKPYKPPYPENYMLLLRPRSYSLQLPSIVTEDIQRTRECKIFELQCYNECIHGMYNTYRRSYYYDDLPSYRWTYYYYLYRSKSGGQYNR
jgi:hypothetical protein